MSDRLPPGWAWATIGDVAIVNPTLSKASIHDELDVSFVPMAAVSEVSGQIDLSDVRPARALKPKSYRSFVDGDVIVAKITPSMENGKAAVARGLENSIGFGSTEFHVLRPVGKVSAEYLFHYVVRERFRSAAARAMTGTAGQLRVPADYLRAAPIPIAPIAEQERIVAAIEEHFSRLDAAQDTLRLAKDRCQALTKSVIVNAVPRETPADWKVVSVADAGETGLGRQRSPKYHTGTNMKPYLRVANVFEDRIDATDVMQMHFDEPDFEKYRLRDGDVLLNEGQSPELLGRPAIYRGEPPDVAFTNSLIRFVPKPGVTSEWALLVFRRHMHAGRFRRESRITTNIAHLALGRFRTVEFPIPPFEVQERIVTATRDALDAIDRRVDEIDRAIATIGSLRRSVLTAAFSGRLVPQDPDDAPASVLLERIAASRSAKPAHRRRTA